MFLFYIFRVKQEYEVTQVMVKLRQTKTKQNESISACIDTHQGRMQRTKKSLPFPKKKYWPTFSTVLSKILVQMDDILFCILIVVYLSRLENLKRHRQFLGKDLGNCRNFWVRRLHATKSPQIKFIRWDPMT